MGYLQSGTPHAGGSVTSFNLTVPVGVTADQFVLISIAGVVNVDGVNCTATSAGATFTTIAGGPTVFDNTVWGSLIKGTGLVAGATITVTLSAARQVAAAHYYFDNDFAAPTAFNARIDSATNVAPNVAVTPGSTVYVISLERSTTAGTSISSVANSNGRTVTQRGFNETLTPTFCTFYLGDFDEPTAASGTTTLTYANTSTSGLALSIQGIDPMPPSSGQITTAMTSWFGPTFLRGGWMTLAGADVRMAVGELSDLSDAVFSSIATVPASGWVTARVNGLDPDTAYFIGLEINGVLQTDGRIEARTLPTEGTATSFCVISGSCQVTGSNHASLAQAATENAAYLLHFGDLHYADAVTEAAWRAAVTSSLTSANMKALMAAFPTNWGWDNHDWGGDLSWSGSPAAGWVPSAYRELTGDLVHATAYYRTWVHGRVRFIRTDMHSQRSNPSDADGPSKVLLGATQKQWWKDTLEAATEPIIVWASGWPNHNMMNGRWGSYATDVDDMEAWLNARPGIKQRLVCLGGDSHDIRADSGTRPPVWQAFSGLPSLNASPFNQAGSVGETQSWDIGQIDVDDARGAYSRLCFTDTGGATIAMTWEAVHDDGTVLLDWERSFSAEAAPEVDALFTGTGTLSASVTATAIISAPFGGTGSLAAVVQTEDEVTIEAPFTGSGSFSAQVAAATMAAEPSFTGSGSLSAAVAVSTEVTASFTGFGTLSAEVSIAQPCDWPLDLGCIGSEWATFSPAVQQRAAKLAGATLRRLTGYRVGGCPITVRPCKRACNDGYLPQYGYGGNGFYPHIAASGFWVNSCGCNHDCSCTELCEIELPAPVGLVLEVKVDGNVIPPSDYRIDNGNLLTWVGAGECPWPTCQDMKAPDSEVGTFSVTFLNAYQVDSLGAAAAARLALEFARACSGGTCALPPNVVQLTRQGVTMELETGAFSGGMTGLRDVDAYIGLWNPGGLRQQTRVWSPSQKTFRRPGI